MPGGSEGVNVTVKAQLTAFNAPTVYHVQVTDTRSEARVGKAAVVWADIVQNHRRLEKILGDNFVASADFPRLPARASGIVKRERVAQNTVIIQGYLEALLRVNEVRDDHKSRKLFGISENFFSEGEGFAGVPSFLGVDDVAPPQWADFLGPQMTNSRLWSALRVPQTQEEYMEHRATHSDATEANTRPRSDSRGVAGVPQTQEEYMRHLAEQSDVNARLRSRRGAGMPQTQEEYFVHVDAQRRRSEEESPRKDRKKREKTTTPPTAVQQGLFGKTTTAAEQRQRVTWVDMPKQADVTVDL